ncbi:MAG TPA: hypothetical protein VEC16_06020 [Alphaproteobacteria bacterium]|nr:hypothetical protein [Alphaproteobacteria bacterium]
MSDKNQKQFTEKEVEALNIINNLIYKTKIDHLDGWAPSILFAAADKSSQINDPSLYQEMLGYTLPFYFERYFMKIGEAMDKENLGVIVSEYSFMDKYQQFKSKNMDDPRLAETFGKEYADNLKNQTNNSIKILKGYIEKQSIVNSVPFLYDQMLIHGKALTINRERWKVDEISDKEIFDSLTLAGNMVNTLDQILRARSEVIESVPNWDPKPKVLLGKELTEYLSTNDLRMSIYEELV